MLFRLSLSHKHIATGGGTHTAFYSALLMYEGVIEEANLKLVKLVGKY